MQAAVIKANINTCSKMFFNYMELAIRPAKKPKITVGNASMISTVGFTTWRTLGAMKVSSINSRLLRPIGTANNIAYIAAFKVPNEIGTKAEFRFKVIT